MMVSILHRITGGALTVAGLAVLAWWMSALAGDGDGYAKFVEVKGPGDTLQENQKVSASYAL